MIRESDLYLPIKSFLEQKGYEVKSEINGCDIVAKKDEEFLIVEMKKSFNLDLVFQGIDRKNISDNVYLAINRPKTLKGNRWKKTIKLCKMLGLGLILVATRNEEHYVEVALDSTIYTPKFSSKKKKSVEKEFKNRVSDFNLGGSSKLPIVTAYKEDALLVALALKGRGILPIAEIRDISGVEKARQIMYSNVYKWFERVEKGMYRLSDKGLEGLDQYKEVVAYLVKAEKHGVRGEGN